MTNFFSNASFTLANENDYSGNTINISFTSISNTDIANTFASNTNSEVANSSGIALNIAIRPKYGQIYPRKTG